jgi:hypothetical protein
MSKKTTYSKITATEIPAGVRFDVPRSNQGQHVEVAYGGSASSRTEHDVGARYKRVTDYSEPVGSVDRVEYFKRA